MCVAVKALLPTDAPDRDHVLEVQAPAGVGTRTLSVMQHCIDARIHLEKMEHVYSTFTPVERAHHMYSSARARQHSTAQQNIG